MVSRKKLLKEPDEFFTISGKVIQFGTRFRKELLIGACALLVLVAGISAMRYFNDKKELQGKPLHKTGIVHILRKGARKHLVDHAA